MQKEPKSIIISKLRERGCRITRQRRIILDIILDEDCSCCKEIYYKACKQDSSIVAGNRVPHGEYIRRNRSDQPEKHV